MNNIPEAIKNFRMLRGLTQKELAERLHKSKNTISNWEQGINSPDVEILATLCIELDITPNQLYGWDECPELEEFLRSQKEIEKMIEQRSDLDKRLKAYSEKWNTLVRRN